MKPHAEVTRSTISRWVKEVMVRSGVDVSIFSPHSTRSASSSKASLAHVPLSTILSTAGWTKETTFSKYYHKKVQNITEFSEKILS